ncbi:MAG: ABC transporter permease [Chloroflexi bacterium]|nr:ABC transporter permease [Chloroflexota bacterium]
MAVPSRTLPSIQTRLDPDALFLQRKPRSLWGDVGRRFIRHKVAVAGATVFILLALVCLVGPWVYHVKITDVDFAAASAPPSLKHPMGTDDLGQDVLARVLFGGRISISVGLVAMLVSITLGALIGLLSGFFGSWLDAILMRLTEVFISIPQLPLLLLIIYLFRDTITKRLGTTLGIFTLMVLVIGGLNWMSTARLVRAAVLATREREFILAARCIGVPARRQIFRHILPNVMSPVIVAGTLAIGSAIIAESTLSFLGLGFPPDTPTWGRMLYDAQNYLNIAPWMAIFPGGCIFLAVLSINYVGDGLRDALDPKLKI